MASISSTGIGSGLDVASIVSQLMAVEKSPLQQMQTEAGKIQSKLSAYGKVQSHVSALRDAALNLTKSDTWGSTSASSGDSSIFTASTSSGATAGSHSVTVQQLASAQTVASAAWPTSGSTVGAGVLRLELGRWAAVQTGFTPRSGSTSVDVTVSETDTLVDVRDKINAAKTDVMASIVNDATGSRLVLRSSESGIDNAFRVTAIDDDGNHTNANGLSALAFDPSVGANAMVQTQAAGNALATIDGLSVSSASNLLTDVLAGVTIKLGKLSSTPVDLSVTSNTDSIKTAVTAFADAYNNLSKFLAEQTRYNAAAKTGATLQGDSGTNALRSAMRNIVGGTRGMTGAFHRLAEIGLDPQSDGSLKVNSRQLDSALVKLTDVKALFANKDQSTDANNGFAVSLQAWGDSLLSFEGALTTRSSSLQRQIDDNTKKQENFNERMTGVEARIRSQYSTLDTQMAKLNSLSSYMTQQITNMNKSST
jgi:flagellar hook-associated protein 2